MKPEDYITAACLSLVGLAFASWLILRRPIDLGRITT